MHENRSNPIFFELGAIIRYSFFREEQNCNYNTAWTVMKVKKFLMFKTLIQSTLYQSLLKASVISRERETHLEVDAAIENEFS